MVSDEEIKKMLKEILENDETCAEKLEELKSKGVSYDKLWNDTLYSEVSILVFILINTLFINICFINICLLHRYLERITSKKVTTSAVSRMVCG